MCPISIHVHNYNKYSGWKQTQLPPSKHPIQMVEAVVPEPRANHQPGASVHLAGVGADSWVNLGGQFKFLLQVQETK